MCPVHTRGEQRLRRAVEAAGIGAPPYWLPEVASTNDVARQLAEEGAPEWTVVGAGHQTEGRGRLGRSWSDVPDRSLLVSLVLRPRLRPEEVHLLALLAAAELVAAVGSSELRSKWPNDLVMGDRKVGGILPEATMAGGRVRFLVLGIGVNVSTAPGDLAGGLREDATSLRAEGIELDPADLLERFLARFRGSAGNAPATIVERYRAICATIGRRVRVTTTTGRAVEGVAVDLDGRGGLVVRAGHREHLAAFGEVAHLR